MSTLGSFGSLQASSWAVQRKEAIEKAKQLKAERGNNLAKTGEMALSSTQYQQKPSMSNQRDNFGSKTAKFDSIDDYSNKRNLASTANRSNQQDILGVRNQNVNHSDYSNNQMNKGTRQYNNTSERISSKEEMDQRNYTMNKTPQNNPNYRKQYKPDFTTDSSPSSYQQQQQNTRTAPRDNYGLKTIPQDPYAQRSSNYQAQQDDYPKNMKPNPVKRNPLQQDYIDSFADRKVQQQPQRRFEQQEDEYDQPQKTYNASNYTRNQDNKGYSATSYQRPSSREVTNNNQYQNQTSVRNPQPRVQQQQQERTFDQDRRIAPPANPVQNASSDEELFECPSGCGRRFFAHVLDKHAKICVKVFQTKRKEFNTAAQRQTEDQQPVPQKKPALKNQKTMQQTQQLNKTSAVNKPIAAKKPDWKQQSEAFRASMKVARGETLSKDEQVAITKNQQDSLVPCHHCGRRFNEKAADRHIPFCQSKQKMEAMKKGPAPKAKPTKKF